MSDSPRDPGSRAGRPGRFRVRVLAGPWRLPGRGLAVSVACLEGQATAPALLDGGGRVVGVSRPVVCFGTAADPGPVELVLHGVTHAIVPGDELVGTAP